MPALCGRPSARPPGAADGGHELGPSVDGDADDEDDAGAGPDADGADPAAPHIDDVIATVARAEHVYTEATVEVSAGRVTLDVELTRPAAAVLRAELEDALTEAAELAATHTDDPP